MSSFRESRGAGLRRRVDASDVVVVKRMTLADVRARSAEALQSIEAVREARNESAETIDAVAREVGELRKTLTTIMRSR